MSRRPVEAVLRKARQMLRNVELGIESLESSDAERQMSGIHAVAVYGRAVTSVLQTLRHSDARFEPWYELRVQEMRADPLLRYFYGLRTAFLKQGGPELERSTSISPGEWREVRDPPPEAFIAGLFDEDDAWGGIGDVDWAIES